MLLKNTKVEKELDMGKVSKYMIPISSEGDFKLILEAISQHQSENHNTAGKEYITNVSIRYNETIIANDIVDVERFIASLKVFLLKKATPLGEDIFFTEKTKDKIKSLQLNAEQTRYVGLTEAEQMLKLINNSLQFRSPKLLYDKFKVSSENYISKERFEELKKRNIDVEKTMDVKVFDVK